MNNKYISGSKISKNPLTTKSGAYIQTLLPIFLPSLASSNQESPQQNQRNTEKLPDVQCHPYLFGHLRIFHKFQPKP